jgi:multiple sugar transport system substrate-binding protein
MNRRDFLKLTGTGLAGASLLGIVGCGGSDRGSGSTNLTLASYPEEGGTIRQIMDRFNAQNEGSIRVELREMPADVGQNLDQLTTEFQAGSSDIDVVQGSSLWLAQFASNGWLSDLSERFPRPSGSGTSSP